MEILVDDVSGAADVPGIDLVRSYVAAVLQHCDGERDEVSLRFVDENEMREMNRTYRDRDASTNVLSFTFEDPPGASSRILGDVLISPEVVAREAETQGKSVQAHYAHLIVHGVLHLCGHDHEQEEAARDMEALEVDILGELGFSDPYQGR